MMLTVLSKSWKATRSQPKRLLPQFGSCLPNPVAHVPTRFCTNAAGQKLDEVTLRNFRHILALRREYERVFQDRQRYDLSYVIVKRWKLHFKCNENLSRICKIEYRKQMRPKAFSYRKAFYREHLRSGPVFYQQLLPVVSRLEALLEADAAQQQPCLDSRARQTLRAMLKGHLEMQRLAQRTLSAMCLAVVSLLIWGYRRLGGQKEKNMPQREEDFTKVQALEGHSWSTASEIG